MQEEPLRIIEIDEKKDEVKFTHGQDITGILESNAECRKESDDIWKTSKDMKRIASIPLAVWLDWEKKGITQDERLLRREIEKNPEYKTTTKRI